MEIAADYAAYADYAEVGFGGYARGKFFLNEWENGTNAVPAIAVSFIRVLCGNLPDRF